MSWQERYRDKLIAPGDLATWAESLRERGETIATLNGSFDLLHAGHLEILYQASEQADRLIVALNSDASIKAYKGPHRPIVPLEYRLQMMASISFVDFVTYFHETDPIALIRAIRPDVHVNGSEYGDDCIESAVVKEVGARLYLVERIGGLSTSEVIANAIRSHV